MYSTYSQIWDRLFSASGLMVKKSCVTLFLAAEAVTMMDVHSSIVVSGLGDK